jgi:hypothetical protein
MPRATKQPVQEVQPELAPDSTITIPPELISTVDPMAWEVIEKMIPIWVKQRVVFLLASDVPEHQAKRQEVFSNLRGAIFANALAGVAEAKALRGGE